MCSKGKLVSNFRTGIQRSTTVLGSLKTFPSLYSFCSNMTCNWPIFRLKTLVQSDPVIYGHTSIISISSIRCSYLVVTLFQSVSNFIPKNSILTMVDSILRLVARVLFQERVKLTCPKNGNPHTLKRKAKQIFQVEQYSHKIQTYNKLNLLIVSYLSYHDFIKVKVCRTYPRFSIWIVSKHLRLCCNVLPFNSLEKLYFHT